MGVERLHGVREKLIRADEHLQAIERPSAEYIVTEEFGISTQWEEHIPEKSGRSGTTWRANLKPPPPLRIAVLCGDFVHNLRSSLSSRISILRESNCGGQVRSRHRAPPTSDSKW